MCENLHDPRLGNDFIEMTPKARAIKYKEYWTSPKNPCASKDTKVNHVNINRVKQQPLNGRKYLQIT